MVLAIESNIFPSKVNDRSSLAASDQVKIDKLEKKLLKKKKEIRIKRAISKTFVFNEAWKRQHFACKSAPDTRFEQFYQRDTYANQKQFGAQICQAFDDLNLTHVLAVAPTQSGKTGSMLAIIREFNKHNATHRVDINHIFIFTGHSSTEWTVQTKKRFPTSLSIFHRNQVNTFIDIVKDLDNILVIFDESHIANKCGQTLYSIYNKLGLFNIKRLYSKNIKIVHFTATPDSIIPYVDNWHNSLKVIHMLVPDSYVSVEHYIHNKQIFECKPLLDQHDNIRDLLLHMDLNDPFYHIIRTPRGQKHFELIQDFKLAFESFHFKYISEPTYCKTSGQVFDLLSHKPTHHTFIFIIDKLRCAKSIHIKHIQICYDRFVYVPNYDSVLQGLLGRCTGFHTHNYHIRIFTFKQFIITHLPNTHNIYYNIFKPC
jgi:hypothetical protein